MNGRDGPAVGPAPPGTVAAGVAGPVVAWFHCFAGIAGDMALGALLDAGADLAAVRDLLGRLPLEGWALDAEPVLRGGLSCTRAVVSVDPAAAGRARPYAAVVALLDAAVLPPRVDARARRTFAALAETEASLHGRPVADVHLHEVGGHDAVVDVVGTAAALEVLGVESVAFSPVAVGLGTVAAAHGVLPNPAPATLRLLEGIATVGRPVDVELTTPTGAALVRALASSVGPLPPMTVAASGRGAGTAELEGLPNCTQVVVGRASAGDEGTGQPLTVLETNLDDVTGEQLAHAVGALLDAGALDAWVTPATMKKGRPGHTLHVLCEPGAAGALRQLLVTTTGTLGVRAFGVERWAAGRRMAAVTVTGEAVRIKVTADRAKAEPDDVAQVAARTGLGVHEVASRAEEAWRRR